MSNSKNKTFWERFKEHFPLEMRAATENVLMAPSQITINKQENVLRGRVESLRQLKNHVFSSNSNSNSNSRVNTPKSNTSNKNKNNNKNKAASRSTTGSSTYSVKSPTNMFGGRRTRRKRRN
jgi:hypothetical protein